MFKNLFRKKVAANPASEASPALDSAAEAQRLCESGFAYHQNGDFASALVMYRKAIQRDPGHFDALQLMGAAFHQSGDHERAVAAVDRALEVNPNDSNALNTRGLALQALGKVHGAIESFELATRLNPEFGPGLYNLGLALVILERWSQALEAFDRAIAVDPSFVAAYQSRGSVLRQLGRVDEALAAFRYALTLDAKSADTLVNQGALLVDLRRWDEALKSLDAATRIAPDHAQAWTNRGSALQGLHRWDEAVTSYDRAIAIQPDFALAKLYRVAALENAMRFSEALAFYDGVIARDPDDAEMHFYRAAVYLLMGDFARGWPEYEWRWKFNALKIPPRTLSGSAWNGEEAIGGKTLLLYCEQGLGDAIQFSRYAALLAKMNVKVILEVPAPLLEVLKNVEGVSQIVRRGSTLPTYDFHCSVLSLPMTFRTDAASIPSPHTYLVADMQKRRDWSGRLEAISGTRLRVGLVASGNAQHKNDRHRSIAMRTLHGVLPEGPCYVSLQKEYRPEDRDYLAGRTDILDLSSELEDLSDTAALIETLDVVISVDTSVAHLAGALGKKVWILLPSLPDWRWLLEREDTPWYPSARLYRQTTLDDWDPVLVRIARELTSLPPR